MENSILIPRIDNLDNRDNPDCLDNKLSIPRVSRSTKSRRSWQSGKSEYWTFIKKEAIIVKYKQNQPYSSRPESESESEITTKSSNNCSQVWKDLGEEVWFDKKEKRREGLFFFLTHGKRELVRKKHFHCIFSSKMKTLSVAKTFSHSFLKVSQMTDPPLVTLKPTNRGNFHCRSHHSAFKCPHDNLY